MSEHRVEAGDEARHPLAGGDFWQESVYLDFVDDAGDLGGYVRIGVYPNLGVTWWTTALVRAGRPSLISASYDLAVLSAGSFDIDERAVRCAYDVVDPLECVSVRASCDATSYATPSDVYGGREAAESHLELDLRWTTDGSPHHYEITTRYEVPCLVEGTVSVEGERLAVRGQGQRDHSWGERDWWTFGWCWLALRMDDGTRLHGAHIRIPDFPALGYEQRGGRRQALSVSTASEVLGGDGLPEAGTFVFEPGGTVHLTPVEFAPLLLRAPDGRSSRFPRAMVAARRDDGLEGRGWVEWNLL